MLVREIQLDEEFENVLRRQTPEENAAMRESIRRNGFLSPLIVWAGTKLLVDGHHRYLEYKRLYEEWKAADAALGMMQRLKGGLKEPAPPDFIQLEFADRDAVKRFIYDTQASRRNLNDAELSLARAKAYQQAAVKLGEKAAREEVATKFDVSGKTVRRDVQFKEATEIVKPVIEATYPGADFMKYVTSPDRPAQAVVTAAADMIKTTPAKVAEAIAMVVNPKLRVDLATDGKPKPPAWEKHLLSFEAVLEKIWSEDDREQIRAVRSRMHKLMYKYFPKASKQFNPNEPTNDEVSAC